MNDFVLMSAAHPVPASPQRMAVLSTEAVDVLYRLGVADRIAGVSGFTVYPPEARHDKPKVSGFKTARLARIQSVQPDLVIGYSKVQRALLDECEAAGLPTLWFNHRHIEGIHAMVDTLGQCVGRTEQAHTLNQQLRAHVAQVQQAAARLPWRPRVYFEEWHTPLTCGIQWVSELITLAGGIDVMAERAWRDPFSARAVTPDEVLAAQPQLVLGAWCGQRFDTAQVLARPGWAALNATVLEMPSSDLLAPGPVALERGLAQMLAAICRVVGTTPEAVGYQGPLDWRAPAAAH